MSKAVDAILPAMEKLDSLLANALRKAEELYGQQSSSDPYRGLYISEQETEQLLKRAPGAPLFAQDLAGQASGEPWDQLKQDFGLEPMDVALILVALAPEFDLRYERLYAYLQDDVTKKRPSVDLALNLLSQSVEEKIAQRERLAPEAPLRAHGLMHLICDTGQPSPPLLACILKLDEQLVKYLFGFRGLDARIAGYCQKVMPVESLEDLTLPDELKNGLAGMVKDAVQSKRSCRVYLQGVPGLGKSTLVKAIAKEAGKAVLIFDTAAVPAFTPEFFGATDLVFRDARFLDAILYIDSLDVVASDDRNLQAQHLVNRIASFPGIVFASGTAPWSDSGRTSAGLIPVTVPQPKFETRLQLWKSNLGELAIDDADLVSLANRFQLQPRQIERAVASAKERAHLRSFTQPDKAAVTIDDLITGARGQSKPNLGTLAARVEPKASLVDIVLPRDQKLQLLEICNQAEYRYVVYGSWGFDAKLSTGKGLNVLFSGPPGTGKTMAAEVIANRLCIDLHKIDLSQIVNKYIGETEKNVSKLFTEARSSNSILFFDEADALFGRRSEVRDAHDRYANVEIAYLLQQMDEYEGISILATNLKHNIDEAFLRRLAFTLDFPFPDETSRRAIWQTAWPPGAPKANIDFAYLARTFKFSGGNIKNAALAAAFLGARKGEVTMPDVLIAARRESEKMGKALSKNDYGAWWDEVQRRMAEDWPEAKSA